MVAKVVTRWISESSSACQAIFSPGSFQLPPRRDMDDSAPFQPLEELERSPFAFAFPGCTRVLVLVPDVRAWSRWRGRRARRLCSVRDSIMVNGAIKRRPRSRSSRYESNLLGSDSFSLFVFESIFSVRFLEQ